MMELVSTEHKFETEQQKIDTKKVSAGKDLHLTLFF